MADKERTDFVCESCGAELERQHWGIAEDLSTYQDLLTCSNPKCPYNKMVRCIHKDLDKER